MCFSRFHTLKAISLGLSLIAMGSLVQAQTDTSLEVVVSRIVPQQGGHLIIALFESSEQWPDLSQARTIRKLVPQDTIHTIRFNELSLNRNYAIQVIHDANDNDQLDINFLPWNGPIGPSEGVGMSNNYVPSFAPRFKPAAFSFETNMQAMEIQLIYLK